MPEWLKQIATNARKVVEDDAFKKDMAELSGLSKPVGTGPERGALGEIGAGFNRGLNITLPAMVGDALKYTSEPGKAIYETGENLVEQTKAREDLNKPSYKLNPEAHNGVTNALAAGADMIPSSLAPAAVVAGGIMAAPFEIPALAALGTTAALGSLPAALSQGQQSYEAVQNAGGSESDAKSAGRYNALIEGGMETAGTFVGAKFLGKAFKIFGGGKVAGNTAESVLAKITKPEAIKSFVKEAGKTYAGEVGTEMIQGGGQSAVERAYGVKDGMTPGQAALSVVPATIGMTTLMLPFGGASHAYNFRRNDKMVKALEDGSAPIEHRIAAAGWVEEQIAAVDPEAAKKWIAAVLPSIDQAQGINIGDPQAPTAPVAPTATPAGPAADSSLGEVIPGEEFNPVAAGLRSGQFGDTVQTQQQDPLDPDQVGVAPRGLVPVPGDQAPEAPALPKGPLSRAVAPLAQAMATTPSILDAAPAGYVRRPRLESPTPDTIDAEYVSVPKQIGMDSGTQEGAPSLDALAHQAATSPHNDLAQPTDAQKDAGNYKVGAVKIQGLDISIENPAGSERSGKDPNGKPWSSTMNHHYGYIKGTVGFDKDHLDTFLGKDPENAPVAFVVDQRNKNGSFDEHKVVLGASTIEEAKQVYLSNYAPGWDGLGAISAMPMDEFKTWAKSTGPRKGALAYKAPSTSSPVLPSVGADQSGVSAQSAQNLILPKNGQPYKTHAGAVMARKSNKLMRTHEVSPHGDGFALTRKAIERDSYADPRLKRAEYRDTIAAFVEANTDEGSLTGKKMGEAEGSIPSLNLLWAQEAIAVAGSRKALVGLVKQAAEGQPLTTKQGQAISLVLDEMARGKAEAALPEAQARLANARRFRQMARWTPGDIFPAALDDDASAGRVFNDDEYNGDWSEEMRTLAELSESAREVDEDATIDILAKDLSAEELARRLYEITRSANPRALDEKGPRASEGDNLPRGEISANDPDAEGGRSFHSEAQYREEALKGKLFARGIGEDDALHQDLVEEQRNRDRTPDRETGLIRKDMYLPTMERAWAEHKKTGRDFAYGTIDFSNLGGVNAYFGGEEPANPLFRSVAATIDTTVKAPLPSAQNLRQGGDEFSTLVPDIKAERLDEVLSDARDAVDALIEAEGLSGISHAKGGKPGVTIYFDSVNFSDYNSFEEVKDAADRANAVNKERHHQGTAYGDKLTKERLRREENEGFALKPQVVKEKVKAPEQLSLVSGAREFGVGIEEKPNADDNAEPLFADPVEEEAELFAAPAKAVKLLDIGDTFEYEGLTYELEDVTGGEVLASDIESGAMESWPTIEAFGMATGQKINFEEQAFAPSKVVAKPEAPAKVEPKAVFGADNKMISIARADELRAKIRSKLSNLNAGVDPEMIAFGTELAVHYIEGGARSFVKFSRKMVAEIGEAAKPYLKSWYMGAKYFPNLDTEGMDTAATVESLNVDDVTDGVESTDVDAVVDTSPDAKPVEQQTPEPEAIDPLSEGHPLDFKADDLDKTIVRNAYSGTSNSPGRAAEVEQGQYVSFMEALRDGLQENLPEGKEEVLDSELQRIKGEYLSRRYRVLKTRSETVSSHVAGGSNFNAKQVNKRGSALDRAEEDFGKWLKLAEAEAYDATGVAQVLQAKKDATAVKKQEAKAEATRRENVERNKQRLLPIINAPGDALEITNEKWRKTHADYKSISVSNDGTYRYRVIMVNGGLSPVFIKDMAVKEIPGVKPAKDSPGSEIATISARDDFAQRLNEGTVTLAEYKTAFASLLANKESIVAELTALTKNKIFDKYPGLIYRYKNDAKPALVNAAFQGMVSSFNLGRSVSYAVSFSSKGDSGYGAAVQKQIDATTDEELAGYAAEHKASQEERTTRAVETIEAVKDPKTLDDFKLYLRATMDGGMSFQEARMTLSPKQRADFDSLAAEVSRSARKGQKVETVRSAGQTVDGEIIETTHTQKGHALFVVQLAERVSKEDYTSLNTSAKKLGGYYSSFRGRGAIPGFQFKTRDEAEAFKQLAGGDTTAAQDAVKTRRDSFADDRSQSAVERLREMAGALNERASAAMSQDRKTNTDRRARMASSAEAQASRGQAFAQTMENLATAIENGTAKLLDRVRQKVQIEYLSDAIRSAHWSELRVKHPTYSEQQKHEGDAPTAETADYAEFPMYTAYRSDLASLGRQLLEVDGTKKLGAQIMKVADDVTSAYLAFAKENTHKVATFSIKDGGLASFASKPAAEAAIKRSGYKGRAIVLQVKRNENLIILSPSEAQKLGVWEGDNDKRITLNADFGAELVTKIGRTRGKVSVPHQFETAHYRRSLLKRMGIETASEFRAALREFIGLVEKPAEANKIKELERAMVGRRKDGLDFFPTPEGIADEMIQAAGIEPGMAILEPSGGWGHIAERIREAGTEPDVVEISSDRRELLEAKGFTLVGRDFMDMSPRGFTWGDTFKAPDGKVGVMRMTPHGGMGSDRRSLVGEDGKSLGYYDLDDLTPVSKNGTDSGYDRIIMNPPFSDRRDAEHVQHAFTLLKPGGRIVAIMGEGVFFGQDKKAKAFRDWLEEVSATDEKLAEGTFLDPSLPVNTGVNTRMVVIDKPADAKPVVSAQPGISSVALAEMKSLKKEVDGETAKLDKLHSLASTRAQATTRNARAGQAAEMRDAKKKQLTTMVRQALEEGHDVPADILETVGASVDYNEEGTYAPVAKPVFSRSSLVTPFYSHLSKVVDTKARKTQIIAKLGPQVATWKDRPSISVVEDESDLPAPIQTEIRSQGAEGQIRAVYYEGRIFMVAANLPTDGMAEEALLHEAVGHYGFRKLFGKNFTGAMAQTYLAVGGLKGVKGMASRFDIDLSDYITSGENDVASERITQQDFERLMMDELMAHMAGKNIKPKLVARIMAAIREGLRALGFERFAEMNDADILRLIGKARDAVVKGKKGAVYVGGTRFASTPAKSTITIDGVERPTFTDWFGSDVKKIDDIPYRDFKLKPMRAVGYRYGAAPPGGKSYNGMTGEQEMGVSLSAITGMEDTKSFAVLEAKAERDIFYYEGDVVGEGGDNEPIIDNYKKLTKDEYDQRSKEIGEFGALQWAVNSWRDALLLQQKGFLGYEKETEDRRAVAEKLFSNQIKSVFTSGAFDGTNPDVRFARVNTANPAAVQTAVSAGWQNAKEQAAERIDYLRMKFQDKFLPLKRAQEYLTGKGWNMLEGANAYLKEELSHGKAEERLEKFQDSHVKPLTEALKAEGVSVSDLEKYLYARHAPERNAYIAEINPAFAEAGLPGSGMFGTVQEKREALRINPSAEIQAMPVASEIMGAFAHAGVTPALERLAVKYDALTTLQRKTIREAGLETEETVQAWERYKHYVPLKGQPGDVEDGFGRAIGRGANVRKSGVKKALGRKSLATNLLGNTVAQTMDTMIRAEKAEIGKAFLLMVEENPDRDMWITHTKGDHAWPTTRALVNGQVKEMPDHLWSVAPNILAVTRDGEIHYIEIKNDDLARVMGNLNPAATSKTVQVMGSITRLLSRINTSLNPEFIVTNFERDLQTAMINLSGEHSGSMAKKVVKGVPSAIVGIRNALRGDKTHDMAKWYDRFKSAGGKVGFMDLNGVDAIQKSIESDVARAQKHPALQKTGKFFTDAGRWINDYNTVIENAVRLSSFKVAIEGGATESEAASLAKNLTVNFNRKGELSSAMNSAYMFFNAGVQGSARIVGALRHPNVRKVAYGVVGMGIALAEMARLSAGADDDDKAWWDKLDNYTKETHLIYLKEDGSLFKVKMPYGYNVFVVLGYAMDDAARYLASGGKEGKSPAESMAWVMKAATNAFNPMGGESSLAQFISPTVLDPFIQVSENKNFFGGPVMPSDNPFGPPKPDSQKYFSSVREPSKKFAAWLNDLTGGTKYESGAFDLSPETIDHFYDFVSGGMGRFIADSPNMVIAPLTGDVKARRVPFLRKVYQDKSEYVDRQAYVENADHVAAQHALYKDLLETGPGEAMRYLKAHPKVSLSRKVKAVESNLRKLRAQRNRVESSGVTEEQKKTQLKALDQQMNRLYKDFNKTYGGV